MIIRYLAAVVAIFTLAMAACSSTSPERPDYNGADSIGGVADQMLIGQWRARSLNPIQGEPTDLGVITYDPEGTVVATFKDEQSGLDLEYEMIGRWSIQGDNVTVDVESIDETSGNSLGPLVAVFMNAFKKNMGGSFNVYESSADRVVVVATTGQAQEWNRIPIDQF